MHANINEIYALLAYLTVGVAWYKAGRTGADWLWCFVLAPLTAPVFWTLAAFHVVSLATAQKEGL